MDKNENQLSEWKHQSDVILVLVLSPEIEISTVSKGSPQVLKRGAPTGV